MTSRFSLYVPIELVSELNQREHWAKAARRKKHQREQVRLHWKREGAPLVEPPITMRLTRFHTARRKIRDFDNLVSSFKAVTDEMAAILGVDDAHIRWPALRSEAYRQEAAGAMGVNIEVETWTN